MTNEANEKLIMLAQMTSESDSSSLKSLVQVYLPILVFIIVGIAISITGIWFTKEWESKLDTSITTSIQDRYFNDVLLSLKQLTHDSTLVKGFFDASEFVSNDEFQTFTQSLLTHNPSTEFCLIMGYGENPSEYYFNTREDITDQENIFTPEIASEEILEIRKSLRKNHGENIVITTNNSSYIVYAQVLDTEKYSNVLVLTGISSKNVLSEVNSPQAAVRLEITDNKKSRVAVGHLNDNDQVMISTRTYKNLNIILNISQKVIDSSIFVYFRWIIIGFSLLATFIFSFQFLNARRSIREFINLTIKRTDELTNINSDLVDEIMEKAKLQSELLKKNHEISDANKQLQEAKSQLIQKEKLASLGQLSAGIAHEINNPIGFVKSNLSMLKKYADRALALLSVLDNIESHTKDTDLKQLIENTKKEQKHASLTKNMSLTINESLEGIDRVKQIIHDLKMFSRMEESEWLKTDIHVGIESTLNIIRSEIKDVADIKKQYGDLPEVECMASQINQVILNLLVNAAHAVAPHGTITIHTYSDDTHVYIQIRDNGCGIEQDIIDRIFDPFFTTKGVGKGTGLGLSLSYGIIEKHNGRLMVESTVGEGTTFTIKLPIHPEKAPQDVVEQAEKND
jgi:signal transduction histidine kinase